jgi:ABC-2 type transport system permease protein
MKQILSITRKELDSYFSSPMALIFLGAFLAVTLFAFFWVETFFARGIADVRPLFRWMPILLIFLVAALTMRQWSEEQRSGTLEMLLTLPVRPTRLVLGKFMAVMALVVVALALTLPLPITVSTLGNLDWGPVVGGYLAAVLLAAAYTAIGLYVSSRTDNQIVALIATVLLGGLFYLVGTGGVTDFAGGALSMVLRAIGTGSRFESIERGVVDARDLIYYGSLTTLFLILNVVSLDSKRWSEGERTETYRRNIGITASLIGLNLVLLNVWVFPLQGLRVDLTQQQEFSLSPTTRDLLSNLQEPLVIRAYISGKTHPLLAPLAPRIQDMLREYAIAANGKVAADVVDPANDPAIEAEAGQTYGIQPTPLQVSGRYEASLINTYFDIVVRYGDQNTVLNFRDLIEVEQRRDGTLDVSLRNLEYDLTRSIKKVVYGFQSVDAVLAAMAGPVKLTLVVTSDTLPDSLRSAPDTIQKVAQEIQKQSNGKLGFEVVNPDTPGSSITRQTLIDTFKLQPIPVSFLSDQTYYMDMLLSIGDQTQVLSPGSDLSEASVRTAIESGLKRASSGFLKVVGLWTPPATPTQNAFGQPQQPLSSWQLVAQQLSQDYNVHNVDLSSGQAPSDLDVLVLIAPQNLSDKERFAVDQYLMRGGAVVVAAGNYTIAPDPLSGGIALQPVQNGLTDMLASYGITVTQGLVMDPQNEPFPTTVTRNVGGLQVQELQAIQYPFFPDVRPDAMDRNSPIVSRLSAVTLNWVSPVELDAEKNANRTTSVLLRSSPQSWLSTNTDIQPNFQLYPDLGFAVEGDPKPYPLAVSVQGSFPSFFKGKPSPFQSDTSDSLDTSGQPSVNPTPTPGALQPASTIEQSPDSARLVVIGSAEFLDDIVMQLSSRLTQDRYLSSLQLAQNAVDWSVEDLDLLGIRSRGTLTRVLRSMEQREESIWEAVNYGVALLMLAGIGAVWRARRRSEQPMELVSQSSSSVVE